MHYLFLFLLCGFITPAYSQQTFLVNHAATGANTGESWADAFPDLQTALASANEGDQIWVAKGVYSPTTDTIRSISFDLPTGVKLYGGFFGTENQLEQRLPTVYKTVLSGEIGVPGVKTDNSFHVVTIFRGNEQTVLDGFTITNGYAADAYTGYPNEYGGGVLVSSDLNWPTANPILTNCVFQQNRAGSGGGIACIGLDWTICTPTIRNCIFRMNLGQQLGGGLFKGGSNDPGNAFVISNCRFEKNNSNLGGGLAMIDATDTVLLRQCVFVNDTAVEAAGAYLQSGNKNAYYEVDSCEFTANHVGDAAGGALEHMFTGLSTVDKIELTVKNSYFLLNKSGTGGGITSYLLSGLNKFKCRVQQCIFESNISQNGGAGILIDAGSGVTTEVLVDRCFFIGNKTLASSVAGAFYYRGFGGALMRNQNTITNSVFMYNDGAVAALGGYPGISHTRVANCSFYRNGAIPFVKYWGAESNPDDLVQTLQILNSVLWEPQTEGVQRLFYNNDPVNFTLNDYLVEHSMVHMSSCEYNGFDPCQAGMIYAQWPNFMDSSGQNGLRTWNFPGRNRGSNAVSDSLQIAFDYYGVPRVYCDTVDMGAYEMQNFCVSAVTEPGSRALLSVEVHILKNPIQTGQTLGVELFAAVSEKLEMRLVSTTGNIVWEGTINITSFVPGLYNLPTQNLSSGLYYLQVSDTKGRTKTEKIVIAN